MLLSEKIFQQEVLKIFPDASPASIEGYLICCNEDVISIKACSEVGLFYGVQAWITYVQENGFHELVLFEQPIVPKRGLKLYLPPPTAEGIAEFKKIIDLAAKARFNFIMLEIGGALEYHSHPEINEGWIEYASFMNEYPGKTSKIQNMYTWRKNSIHSENGGGNVLPQAELLKLADYCKERYMELIPEMPCLSHSDYLLTRHRELSERQEDAYPDTCCPSNPEYYRILFDLFDEVIDLLHPRVINICHDEYYTIGLCPRCKGRSAPELFAEDVNKITAYLKSRNVQTSMWGEKLLDSHWRDGGAIGGAHCLPYDHITEDVPATFPAIDLIDPSVEIFHWYWSIDRDLEKAYQDHNMRYCFANFAPQLMKDWNRRMHHPLVSGICISNWGRASIRTLQRNGLIYSMFYADFMVWNPDFGSEDFPDLDELTRRRLYRFAQPEKTGHQAILTVCHTVQTPLTFRYFVDGYQLHENRYYLGDHVFRSAESGKEFRFPVIFGSNINNTHVNPIRSDDPYAL